MLELAILGLLKEQPMHGYQLSRELASRWGGSGASPTAPSTRRCGASRTQGAVEQIRRARRSGGARTSTASPNGRDAFLELLQETPADNSTEDTRFRVRLAFFKYLPPETRIRLLERRRAFLEDRLSTIKARCAPHASGSTTTRLSLMEHGREPTERTSRGSTA